MDWLDPSLRRGENWQGQSGTGHIPTATSCGGFLSCSYQDVLWRYNKHSYRYQYTVVLHYGASHSSVHFTFPQSAVSSFSALESLTTDNQPSFNCRGRGYSMSSEQMIRSGHCKLYFPDRLYLPLQLDDPIGPACISCCHSNTHAYWHHSDTTGIVYKASLRGVCVCVWRQQ